MSKVKLGPTKGTVDEKEFDIVDNVLKTVKEYEQALAAIEANTVRQIEAIELEAQRKKDQLRAKLLADLGANKT